MSIRRILSKNLYLYRINYKLKELEDKYKKIKFNRLPIEKKMEILSTEYKLKTGESLDWNNIYSYNEKIQRAKLFDLEPIKTELADKFLVRNWVSNKIGSKYLIPLLGAWDSFDDIDFSALPNQFVLKVNNASGTNIIVKEKEKMDVNRSRILVNWWLKRDYSTAGGFQMQYKNIVPKIIAEKYIVDNKNQLNDYRFMCFDGKVYYCIVDVDHRRRNIYDLDWKLQNWQIGNFVNYEREIEKPQNFKKMIEIVEILCEGFPHVRVDLYNVDGKIFFGEMTFTHANGFQLVKPHTKNLELGHLWIQ